MTLLEIAANAITTVSILLAGRNSVQTWWTGIVGGLLFALLFFENQLYADVTLQGFFIATSVIGWIRWLRGDSGAPLQITRTSPLLLAGSCAVGFIVALGYGFLLDTYTNAYAPFWDSAILVASVVAQFLLMGRKLENWYVWLLVNSIAVPLYASRGLFLTAALYAAYWVNALVSVRKWQRDMDRALQLEVARA